MNAAGGKHNIGRGHAELLLATTSWALGSGILIKSVSSAVPALVMYAMNALCGMVVTAIFFAVKDRLSLHLPKGKADRLLLFGGGLTLTVSGVLMISALQMTEVAKVVLIRSLMTVVFVFLAARLFLKEHPTRIETIAAPIGFIGIVILMSDRPTGSLIDLGAVIAFISMFFSVGNLVFRRLLARREVPPEIQTVYQNALSVLMVMPFAIVALIQAPEISGSDWLLMALNGAITRGFGFVLWYRGNQDPLVTSSQVSLITFIEPLGATLLAALWLHEPLTMSIVFAALLIVVSGLMPLIFRKTR